MKRKRKPRRKLKGRREEPSSSPKRVVGGGKRTELVGELKCGFYPGTIRRKWATRATLTVVQKWVRTLAPKRT